MKTALDNVILLVTCLMVAIVLTVVSIGTMDTGPNCPGKDPEWLGYCAKALPRP